MRNILIWLCFILFVQSLSAQQAILSEAAIYKESDYKKSLELYEKVLEIDSNNVEALSEAGFLLTKIGNKATNKEEKEVYFRKAIDYTKKAVMLDPSSYFANYTYGVALGRIGDISGARERVQNSQIIKNHCEKALEINPNHAPSWHLLGRLNYRLANLNVAERAAAAVLFGGLPKGVSNEKALECYEKAVELRGDYLLYRLDLAIILIKLKNNSRAKEVLDAAIKLPIHTEDEKDYMADCQSLLHKLK
jgi:tetratricopeptide (TPR) repeat protein